MIRLLLLIGLLFAAAAGAGWVADRLGAITVVWRARPVELSPVEALAVGTLLFGAIVGSILLVRALFAVPAAMRARVDARRRERGLAALSDGLVAVAVGDLRAATRAAAEAERMLPDAPLTRLLSAQAAQLAGDTAGAGRRFLAMATGAELTTLGLRGLHMEALRAGDLAAARAHARAANAADPALPWAARAAFDAATQERDWAGALVLLDQSLKHGHTDRATHRRHKAVLLLGRARDLAAEAPDEARQLALEAHGLARDLTPAAVLAARLAGSERRKAVAAVEAAWRAAPHPELMRAALDLEGGGAAERLKRAEALAAAVPGHVEGALGVARAALAARDLARARAALAPFAEANPSQRVCVLMAEIEAIAPAEEGRVRAWLARAVRAPRDPAWIADGVVSPTWEPVSPVTGRLDAFSWAVPPDAGETPLDLALLSPPASAPSPSPPPHPALPPADTRPSVPRAGAED